MIIRKGYKTELKLNNKQKTACIKHAGVARFAYNWGLKLKQAAMNIKAKIPNSMELHKKLNELKETEFPWMYEVSKCAPQGALKNLDNAMDHFFRKCKLKKEGKFKGKIGFPVPKTKKKGIGSFRLDGTIKVTNSHVQLPRIGKVKLKEKGYIPTDKKIISATISEHAGRWFVSILVEEELPEFQGKKDDHDIVGVDLGIKTLGVCSDGKDFENPKALRKNLKKIKRQSRSVSRKKKGGKNRKKAVKKLANTHCRVANIRKDTLHQMTSTLAKTKRGVGIEDLNVAGMLKNHKLAQAISDVGFGELRRQLIYKGKFYNCEVILVDRFFPSSKMCHKCGHINHDLKLSDRKWTCSNCGTHHDRDFNASMNLENVAISSMETKNALRSGEALAWSNSSETALDAAGMKQEFRQFCVT